MEKLTRKQQIELGVMITILKRQSLKIDEFEDLFPDGHELHDPFRSAWLKLYECRKILSAIAETQKVT